MGLGQLVDGTQILDYLLLLFWGDNSVTMLIKKTESHPSLGVVYYTCILHITDHTDLKRKSLFAAADALKKKTSPAVPPC